MRCKHCGNDHLDSSKFCAICGNPVGVSSRGGETPTGSRHFSPYQPLQFSPGDIFAERDSFLVQWNGSSILELTLDPERWRERACIAAGRNLTADEWATYIGGTPRATCPQYPAPT